VTLDIPVTPDVSVVIVAFRARDYVLASLRSLQAHADMPYEAIVVDDGSSDGTAVTVVEKPQNEGLVAGRNTALPLVHGRVVLMLDSDTEILAGSLSRLAAVLDTRPEVGLVGPKLVYPDGTLQLSCRRYPPLLLPFLRRGPYARVNPDPQAHRRHMMADDDHGSQRPVVWLMGAAQMWRRDLPDRIGAYDHRLSSYGGEDQDWCMRVWSSGLEVRYVPEAEIMHVFQKATRRSMYGRKSLRTLRDFYYLQWKHRRLRGDPRLCAARR